MNTGLLDQMRMVLGGLAKFDSWLGVEMDAIIKLGKSGGGRLDVDSLRHVVGMYVGARNVGEINVIEKTFYVTINPSDCGDNVSAQFGGFVDEDQVINVGTNGIKETVHVKRDMVLYLYRTGRFILLVYISDFSKLVELLVQLWPGMLQDRGQTLKYLTMEPILWYGDKKFFLGDWNNNLYLRYRVYMEVSQFMNIFCEFENLPDINNETKTKVVETVLMMFTIYDSLKCVDLINILLGKLLVDRSKLTEQESRDLSDRLKFVSEQRTRRWGTWGNNKQY